mmetsp:Transcript_23085/g.66117  ORF Transcript_23085/g.66117 Transcript_23085/m.66117 type:complete len:365 (+) Transcript_23085:1044-2138(+)
MAVSGAAQPAARPALPGCAGPARGGNARLPKQVRVHNRSRRGRQRGGWLHPRHSARAQARRGPRRRRADRLGRDACCRTESAGGPRGVAAAAVRQGLARGLLARDARAPVLCARRRPAGAAPLRRGPSRWFARGAGRIRARTAARGVRSAARPARTPLACGAARRTSGRVQARGRTSRGGGCRDGTRAGVHRGDAARPLLPHLARRILPGQHARRREPTDAAARAVQPRPRLGAARRLLRHGHHRAGDGALGQESDWHREQRAGGCRCGRQRRPQRHHQRRVHLRQGGAGDAAGARAAHSVGARLAGRHRRSSPRRPPPRRGQGAAPLRAAPQPPLRRLPRARVCDQRSQFLPPHVPLLCGRPF